MRFIAWFLPSLLLSVLCAWMSVELQQAGFAPLGVHSVVMGGVLGAAFVGLAALVRLRVGRVARIAVCLLAFSTAVLQHVAGYRQYQASFHRVISTEPRASWAAAASKLQPAGFLSYLRARTTAAHLLLWGLDTVLITLTGSVIFFLGGLRLADHASHQRPDKTDAEDQLARGDGGHAGNTSSLKGR